LHVALLHWHLSGGPGFQLSLGLKDVTLALDVAHKVPAPVYPV
jgi:3-hydroxyisobutyrate dehydrogenase-like beta-hydroxyacid dehydrogenase